MCHLHIRNCSEQLSLHHVGIVTGCNIDTSGRDRLYDFPAAHISSWSAPLQSPSEAYFQVTVNKASLATADADNAHIQR